MQTYSYTIANTHDGINKDRFLIKNEEKWFTVCDGVSSKGLAGAKAAQIAIDDVNNTHVSSIVNKGSIKKFLKSSGEKIKKIYGATTFTSLFLKKEKAILFHTGDSECYFIYNDLKIKEWTIPKTLAYGLYKSSELPKENIKTTPGYSNVLVECLDGKEINPQISELSLKNVWAIVLCTDGVNKVLPNMISSLLKDNYGANGGLTVSEFRDNPAKILCEKALELKSQDDITAIVIKL